MTSAILQNLKNSTKKTNYKWEIVWGNVFLIGLIHILFLYGTLIRYIEVKTWSCVIFVKIIGCAAGLGITAGCHRLWCHRSYKANLALEILLMIMSSITYQNSIYIWCRDHRLHHKYTETNADPHNAKRGLFFSHVGWLFVRKHPDVIEKGKLIDMSDLKNNKVVMFQHKYYIPIIIFVSAIIPIFIAWYFCGESFKTALLLGTVYRHVFILNITWCINSLAHYSGNKPFNTTNGSVENFVAGFLALGEGFHNYHHTFPYDYRASASTDVRNVTTYFIDFFSKIGWATDLKIVPNQVIEQRAVRTGDGTYVTSKDKISTKDKLIKYLGQFLFVVVLLLT